MNILELRNVDPDDEQLKPVLAKLQGNILKGHGRDYTLHLFFQFRGDLKANKELIRELAKQVTSAEVQREDTQARRERGEQSRRFCNILLTARGYKEGLGYTASDLARAFPEPSAETSNTSVKFINGMAFHHQDLSDPPLNEWDRGYANPNASDHQIIDGMVLLANDDKKILDQHGQEIENTLRKQAEVLAIEKGRAYFNEHKTQNLEHFGYVDGRSQPTFYLADFGSEQQKKDGTNEWDPSEPLGLVLVEDKLAKGKKGQCFGSYFVFRKLEQNVKGFKEKEQELAEALGLEGEKEKELAGALAVGRFEDGTPVVLRPFDGLAEPVPNNFRFDQQDPKGLKCPFHAHIRKVNPRGDTIQSGGSDAEERTHRIARRGITYGDRDPEPKDDPPPESCPEKDVGLLFMCFQANIDNQFAYIQRRFADNPDFSRRETGLDPVIAQSENAPPVSQKWPVNWGDPYVKKFPFPSFVTMKGGDFFFAPSITFLKTLP